MYTMGKEAAELFLGRGSYKTIGNIEFNKTSKFIDHGVFLIKYLLPYESKNVYFLLFIREECYDIRTYKNFQEIYCYFNDIASTSLERYVREE